MRQFKTTKPVISKTEQQKLRDNAIAQTEKNRLTEAEKERLVKEGKMRKIVTRPDSKTINITYEWI